MTDFQLEKGSIWEVFYMTKAEIYLDPKTEEILVDRQTREISSNTFDPPPGLSPAEYSALFVQHFTKSRSKSREIVKENKEKTFRHRVLVQVGNQECTDDLKKIEESPEFKSWENPSIVEHFRQISREYLNG